VSLASSRGLVDREKARLIPLKETREANSISKYDKDAKGT